MYQSSALSEICKVKTLPDFFKYLNKKQINPTLFYINPFKANVSII